MADQQAYLYAGLRELACDRCGALVRVKKNSPEHTSVQWSAESVRGCAEFADFISLGFQQDVEIWTHKTKIDNPLLCAEDGPVYQLRRWYEQFYTDVADVTPDMVARHEYEIDTTRAVQSWEAEVAANLAARADQ